MTIHNSEGASEMSEVSLMVPAEKKRKQRIENLIRALSESVPIPEKLFLLLVPDETKEGKTLPQLVRPHICLENFDATVLIIQKFLKAELNLEINESEIEISCGGRKLNPTMNFHDIKRISLECLLSVEKGEIQLVYSRRNP